jgi:hypothetical protein
MLHDNLAHGLLAAVYAATAVILAFEQALAHAICAAATALIYAVMSTRRNAHGKRY